MSSQIITETTPAPRYDLNERQMRNRRLFLRALENGVRVVGVTGHCYYVTSQSRVGLRHQVEIGHDVNGQRVAKCDCDWGRHQGWVGKSIGPLPCSHILVVKFFLMSPEAQADLCDADPGVAALVAMPARRTERVAA